MRIAIIGCGNMGKAMAARLSEANTLFFYDRTSEKSAQLEQSGFGAACKDIREVLHSSELIILAIKPQSLQEASETIASNLQAGKILVSLLSGTSIATLHRYFPSVNIVRMMPNLALLYGEGIIGLCADRNTKKEEKDQLARTFEPLGKIHWLPEEKMNALTALGGSGPAFFFVMIEAMIDAGIAMGFTAENSQELVQQMLYGSLTLLEKTRKHPGELKWQIASPGGTTIAGLKELEEHALRSGIMNTFLAAYERAHQLSVPDDADVN